MSNPKLLNLDEIEVTETDVTIIHKGVEHGMATMTVEGFLKQQLRATKQTAVEQRIAEAGDVAEDDTVAMIRILQDGVQDFFPTLPVGELEVPKLLKIFAWLNELAAKISEDAPVEATDEAGDASAEGNAETVQS